MEINLARKIGKNLLMAYLPSVVVSLLILVVSNLNSTQSKNNCWKIIREKEPIDYVVFLLSFVLPNLVALGVILGYLMAYVRLMPKKHSIFLAFPVVAVPFLVYGLTVKMLTFFGIDFLNGNGELPLMVEPITHALVFILVLRSVRRVKPKMSDITLGNEEGEGEGENAGLDK
jgi:membrane associated rhomboid family serine protease